MNINMNPTDLSGYLEDCMMMDWLMANGGPIIRYRTSRELIRMDTDSREVKELRGKLLETPEVSDCIGKVAPSSPNLHGGIHGSFDSQFENSMARAINLGLHKGLEPLDKAVSPWLDYIRHTSASTPNPRELFNTIIVAGLLMKAGYNDGPVAGFLTQSLKVLGEFCRKRNHDFYRSDIDSLKGIPGNFQGRPIIRHALYGEVGYIYPLIYDIIGLSGLSGLKDKGIDTMISEVIGYILTPEFHGTVADGYGILVSGPKKYHSMGWDPKVPGFGGICKGQAVKGNRLLYAAYLHSSYPEAVETKWFADTMAHLEGFRTPVGTYLFPRDHVPEKTGYAVMGNHMGLGENRRNRNAIEVESTFWMMRIRNPGNMA